jgi:hypothetical protein
MTEIAQPQAGQIENIPCSYWSSRCSMISRSGDARGSGISYRCSHRGQVNRIVTRDVVVIVFSISYANPGLAFTDKHPQGIAVGQNLERF